MLQKTVLFLIFLTIPLSTYGDCKNSCKIQDAPAKALEVYIDNINTILSEIQSSLSKTDSSPGTIEQERLRILWSLSSITNFSSHYSSFDFYVALPITTEIPYPVKRDHQRLQQQTDTLTTTLQRLVRRWHGSTIVSDPCSGIDNCDFRDVSVRYILTELIKNNKNITDFYRLSIIGKPYSQSSDFVIVPDGFDADIEEHYNSGTLFDCSQCDEWFADRLNTSIDKISNLSSEWSDGIQKWKDAWARLIGGSETGRNLRSEQELLNKKLAQDGVSGDAAEVVVNNLTKTWWFSTNNPLFNSANYTFSRANQDIDSFKEASLDHLLDTSQEEIPIVIITQTSNEKQRTEDIANNVASLYEKQLPFIRVQDSTSQKLIAKIIQMHYSLTNSINILDPVVDDAEIVCDSQWQGKWKCQYR